jgi:tRNA/rRNA methyltransferase
VSASSELDNLRVVLVNTRNPLNIGAVARAMSNFGCFHLRVVNPYEEAWREARSAVGGAPLLADAEEFSSIADAVADCSLVIGTTAARDRELNHHVRTPREAEPLIRERLHSERIALLFGSEKRGLSNEDLSHCHWLLRIPTRAEHGSMNLGQAVAVCLYEFVREIRTTPDVSVETQQPPASASELERITAVLLEALTESGYSDGASVAATEEKVRRLVRRLSISHEDADLVVGMLRKVLWKLRHP